MRVEHRHGEKWVDMMPDKPELTDDRPRRWRSRFRCACGFVTDSIVPS